MNTEEMHATVDQNLRSRPFAVVVADQITDSLIKAGKFAPFNNHLLQDEWISSAMSWATSEDHNHDGMPDLGDAVLVQSNDYSVAPVKGDKGMTRHTSELPAVSEPETVRSGFCHKCDAHSSIAHALGQRSREDLSTFHLSRGRFVVSFRLCSSCMNFYEFTYGPITLAGADRGAL